MRKESGKFALANASKLAARIALALLVLAANALVFMWLGRLQLAGYALQSALAQRGMPARVQVSALDETHIHLAEVDFAGKSRLRGLDVAYTVRGLRHRQLGDIRLANANLFLQQGKDGWQLDGHDLTKILNGGADQEPWKTGSLDLQVLQLSIRSEHFSAAGFVKFQMSPEGYMQVSSWKTSGQYQTSDEQVNFSDALVDMQMGKSALSMNLAGRIQLARTAPDEGWQVQDGRLHMNTDLMRNGEKWQGPIRLDSQLSDITHPAISARTMKLDGQGDITLDGNGVEDFSGAVTIQGNGVDLSRYGLVRQVEFMPDLDHLLQPVVRKIDDAQKDMQVSLFTSVRYRPDQLSTGDAPAQLTLDGKGSQLVAHLSPASVNPKDGTFSFAGDLGIHMPGLAWANIRQIQATGSPADLDVRTTDANAHVTAAGRSLDVSSTQGRMIRRPSRLYWSGPAQVQWDGELMQAEISGAQVKGQFGLDLQPGETKLTLIHGPGELQAKAIRFGAWRGHDIRTDFQTTQTAPLLRMSDTDAQVRMAMHAFSAHLGKSGLSDFKVSASGTGANINMDFPAGQPATADLSLQQLDMDMSGEQNPHIAIQQAEINARRDLGQWHGKADLESAQLKARDLPVTVTGAHPDLQFALDKSGLHMDGTQVMARLTPLPDFTDMMPETYVRMDVHMADGRIGGVGKSYLFGTNAELGDVNFTHELDTGAGSFHLDNAALMFRPGRLQPRELLPSLAGLVANVDGRVTYEFHGSWDPQGLQETGGEISSNGTNFDLMLGRVEGVSGTMHFSSLLPLRTAEPAKIHVGVLDPGIEVTNGEVVVAFNRDGEIDIDRAHWPFADGEFFLQPMHWVVGGTDQTALLKVHNVDLLQLSGLLGLQGMSAKGKLSGDIPLHMANNTLYVEKAKLSAAPPGVLQYTGSVGSNASKAAPQAKLAFDVLKDLHFDQLELSLDGDVAGRMEARLTLQGKNPDVLDGAPFLLHINTSAEFARLLRQSTQGGRIAQTISTTLEHAHKKKNESRQNQP